MQTRGGAQNKKLVRVKGKNSRQCDVQLSLQGDARCQITLNEPWFRKLSSPTLFLIVSYFDLGWRYFAFHDTPVSVFSVTRLFSGLSNWGGVDNE